MADKKTTEQKREVGSGAERFMQSFGDRMGSTDPGRYGRN